jgi:hypothetical protein
MTARQFINRLELVGILPERRKDPKRIPEQSIINLGKKLFGDNVNFNHILFIQKSLDAMTEKILRFQPHG